MNEQQCGFLSKMTPRLTAIEGFREGGLVTQVRFCGREQELNQLQKFWNEPPPRKKTVTFSADQRHGGRQPNISSAAACEGRHYQAIFIQGAPGIGKSALVEEFLSSFSSMFPDTAIAMNTPMIGRGSFEQAQLDTKPLAALEQATIELLHSIVQHNLKRDFTGASFELPPTATVAHRVAAARARFRKEILDASEWAVLEASFPLLKQFFSSNWMTSSKAALQVAQSKALAATLTEAAIDFDEEEMEAGRWRFERLAYSWRDLIRAIARRTPVILALDDIHFASYSVIKLLGALFEQSPMDSPTISSDRLLLLAAHRPIARTQLLSKLKSALSPHQTATIMVHPLTVQNVCQILVNAGCEREDVPKIANHLQAKTKGNAFFVVESIRLLQAEDSLSQSNLSTSWVQNVTVLANSITALLQVKIGSGTVDERIALVNAAFLGSNEFDLDTLSLSLATNANLDSSYAAENPTVYCSSLHTNPNKLFAVLQDAVASKLLRVLPGRNRFEFAHSLIREAAYAQITGEKERERLHAVIGRRLLSRVEQICNETSVEVSENATDPVTLLMTAVDQLLLGTSHIMATAPEKERLDLVKWYSRAAAVATRLSCFDVACNILRRAVHLLGDGLNVWTRQYNVNLMLTSARARVEFCSGRYEQSFRIAETVMMNGVKVEDKRSAYHTQILCMLHQNRVEEAKGKCKWALIELHETPLPRAIGPSQVSAELRRTDRMLADNGSTFDILSLPRANRQRRFIGEILERIAEIAEYQSDYYTMLVARLRSLQLTVCHGYHSGSACALITWGRVLVAATSSPRACASRWSQGVRYGTMGLHLAARTPEDTLSRRAISLFHLSLEPRLNALPKIMASTSLAVYNLWEAGAVQHFIPDTVDYLLHSFLSGCVDLATMEKGLQRIYQALHDFNHHNCFRTTIQRHACLSQAVAHLRHAPDEDRSKGTRSASKSSGSFSKSFSMVALVPDKGFLQLAEPGNKRDKAGLDTAMFRTFLAYLLGSAPSAYSYSLQIMSSMNPTSSSVVSRGDTSCSSSFRSPLGIVLPTVSRGFCAFLVGMSSLSMYKCCMGSRYTNFGSQKVDNHHTRSAAYSLRQGKMMLKYLERQWGVPCAEAARIHSSVPDAFHSTQQFWGNLCSSENEPRPLPKDHAMNIFLQLLRAEYISVGGEASQLPSASAGMESPVMVNLPYTKSAAALVAYHAALEIAQQQGNTMVWQALIWERAGAYLLEDLLDRVTAVEYLGRARNLYRQWGALAKVHEMNQRYENLFQAWGSPSLLPPQRVVIRTEPEVASLPQPLASEVTPRKVFVAPSQSGALGQAPTEKSALADHAWSDAHNETMSTPRRGARSWWPFRGLHGRSSPHNIARRPNNTLSGAGSSDHSDTSSSSSTMLVCNLKDHHHHQSGGRDVPRKKKTAPKMPPRWSQNIRQLWKRTTTSHRSGPPSPPHAPALVRVTWADKRAPEWVINPASTKNSNPVRSMPTKPMERLPHSKVEMVSQMTSSAPAPAFCSLPTCQPPVEERDDAGREPEEDDRRASQGPRGWWGWGDLLMTTAPCQAPSYE